MRTFRRKGTHLAPDEGRKKNRARTKRDVRSGCVVCFMTANLRMVSTPSISITGSSLSSVSPPAPPQQITASVFHPYRLPPARPGNHPVKGRLAAPWTKVSSRPLLVPVNTENRTSCSQSVSQSVHRWYALSGRQIEVLSCRADATHYARYNEMSSVIEGDTELHFQ